MPKLSEVLDSDPSCEMGHIDRYSKVKPNSKSNNKKFRPRFDIQSVDRFNSSRRAICSTQKIYDDDSLSSKSEIWESLWRQNDKHLERQGNNSRSRSVGRVQISYVSDELDRRTKRRHQHDQSTNNRKFPESKHGSILKSPNANNSSCCCCYVNPPLLRCPPADMNCDEFVLTPCQIDVLLSLAATHASNTAMVDNCKFALLSCDYHTIINNYIIAAKFDLYDVTERLMDQIRANFVCVARTKEFLSLPLDIVMMFLQDNNLNVEDELEIFFAALNWVDFNKMQRLPDAGKVLNCVRYVYINPSDILQYVEPNLHMFTGPHGTEAMLNMYRYRALILSGTIPAPQNVTPFCQPPATLLQEVDPQASNLVAPIPPPRSLPPDPNIPPSQFAMFPPQGFMGPCEPPPLPPRSWSPGPDFQQVNTVTMYSPQDTPIVRPQSPLETINAPPNLPFSCLPVGYIPPPLFVPEGMYNSRLTMPGPLSPAAGTPQPPSKSPSAASQAKQPSPESKGKGAAEKSKSASETKLKDKEPSKTSSKTDEGKDGKKDKAERSKDDKKDKSEKKQDSSKSAPEPQTMKEILTKLKSEKKDKNKKGKEKSSSKSKKKEAEDEEDDSTEDNDDKDKEEKSKKSKNKQSPTSKSSSKEKSSKKTKGNKEDKKDDSEKGKKSSKKKKRDDDDDDEDDDDDDEDDEKEDEEKVNKSKSQSKTKAQSKAASREPGKDKQREADSEENEDDEKKPKTKSGTKSKSQKEDKKQETGGKSANDSPEVNKGSSKSASKEDKIKKGSNPDDDKKSKNKDDKKSESSRSKKEKKERRTEKKSDEEDKEGRSSKRDKSGEKKERRDEKKSSEEDKEGRRSKRDKSGEKKERHKSRSKTKDKNDSPSSQTDDDDQKSSPKRRRHKSRRSKSQSSESPDSSSKKRSKQKSTRSESRVSRRGTMFLGHMKR
ncbi:hypothetical protein Btru_057587 [Bulinus truncatus]|nr:hypothetical protein Btru_057587 [Bulinus truncatus]